MRSPRNWTATVGVAIVVFGTSGCGGSDSGDGAALYRNNGCAACHGTDRAGTGAGPSLLYERGDVVELRTGDTIVVDDTYVRLSLTNPGNNVTAGWSNSMPATRLGDDDIDTLVTWLLGGEAPDAPADAPPAEPQPRGTGG